MAIVQGMTRSMTVRQESPTIGMTRFQTLSFYEKRWTACKGRGFSKEESDLVMSISTGLTDSYEAIYENNIEYLVEPFRAGMYYFIKGCKNIAPDYSRLHLAESIYNGLWPEGSPRA